MNYQDLFYFIKVAEKGSIVAAADFLKIPTSTLSRRLQTLEQDLGYTLELYGQTGVFTSAFCIKFSSCFQLLLCIVLAGQSF